MDSVVQATIVCLRRTIIHKAMKKYVLLFSSFLFSVALSAQELPYTFTVESAPYADLVDPISINNGESWDDPEYFVPIGFDFVFNGTTYNQLFFGGITSYGGEVILGDGTTTAFDILMPYNQDIMDGGYDDETVTSDSPLSYQVIGEPGARIFKMEWKNCAFYNDNVASTMRISFQMWLYETTNNIEFWYGPNANLDNAVIQDLDGIIVGMISGLDISTGFPIINNGAWMLSGDPLAPGIISPTTLEDFEMSTYLSDTPSFGTVYAFRTGIASVQESAVKNSSLFPTLVTDFIQVNWTGTDATPYAVFDATGKMVLSSTFANGFNRIEAANWPAGVYMVRSLDAQQAWVSRVVKQ
jgi:hypothetical protein